MQHDTPTNEQEGREVSQQTEDQSGPLQLGEGAPKISEDTRAVFWGKVTKSGPVLLADSTECWIWRGALDKDGYGNVSIHGKRIRAHRLSWEINIGDIPEGLCVCHHCDNPSCVNPDHLWLGTNAENTADKVAKGRQARGEKIKAVKKTHCIRGHELSVENVRQSGAIRHCRLCQKVRSAENREIARLSRGLTPQKPRGALLSVNGITQTFIQWSRQTGVHPRTIRFRIKNGCSPESAIQPIYRYKTCTPLPLNWRPEKRVRKPAQA